jgi:hypothetical protein
VDGFSTSSCEAPVGLLGVFSHLVVKDLNKRVLLFDALFDIFN